MVRREKFPSEHNALRVNVIRRLCQVTMLLYYICLERISQETETLVAHSEKLRSVYYALNVGERGAYSLPFARGQSSSSGRLWQEETAGQVCLHECIPGTQQPAGLGVTPLRLKQTA
jgi:hypothetical protein